MLLYKLINWLVIEEKRYFSLKTHNTSVLADIQIQAGIQIVSELIQVSRCISIENKLSG